MRILFINEGLVGAGGVETYLSAVIGALHEKGHQIGLLHDNPASDEGALRILEAGAWRASLQDEGLAHCLDRLRDFAPDVCFSHNMRHLEADAALLTRWPVVKMLHTHFGTCVSGQKAFTWPSTCACTRELGVGCLAYYLPRGCGYRNPVKMLGQYRRAIEQRSLTPRYRAVVVASRFMRDEYLRSGAVPDRTHVLPLFAPRQPVAVTPTRGSRSIDVAFLGRMTNLKGADVLLRACARVGDRLGRRLYVQMAGEGPERERLQELAASLGLDASFPGWLDGAHRDALLSHAAVVAVPSLWPEPFGLVGLEAAVFGTPAVAFDAGGISEWLTDRFNGRLVPAAEGAEGLATAIAEILRDDHAWSALSDGARSAASRFSLESHLVSLEAILSRAALGVSIAP